MDGTTRVEVADGVSLAVDVAGGGDGPPFLLVHGLASCRRLWDGVVDELVAAGHRVAAVDLRGHGDSDRPDEGYDVTTVAADLAAVIDGLALDRPVLAGQSWGGNVGLALAASRPDTVRALACVDGGWIELQRVHPVWEDCERALAPPATEGLLRSEVEAMVRGVHPDWPEAGIAGVLACFDVRADGTVVPLLTHARHLLALRGLWEHRPSEVYAAVAVPVALVAATNGVAGDGRADAVTIAAGTLPDARLVWLEGDHDLHAQHPRQVAAELLELATP